jgi:DNA-binding NtrC family response regulator
MSRLLELAQRVALTDANVLVCGESGTGKEWLARFLHAASPRRSRPFVTLSCQGLPDDRALDEMIGCSAELPDPARRRGRFEEAEGGTIFIDGLSELSPAIQGRLLRIVEDRGFERPSGGRPVTVDVRIVSSTHVDPEPLVAGGQLRKDLYYRLNVFRLDVPPLRERREDLEDLAAGILDDRARSRGGAPRRLSPGALDRLLRHDWPGNLRELRNVLESAEVLDDRLDLPAEAIRIGPFPGPGPVGEAIRGRYSLAQLEEQYIREVLRLTRGNRTDAARILGINRKTLLDKRKKYGIP